MLNKVGKCCIKWKNVESSGKMLNQVEKLMDSMRGNLIK